MNARIFALIPCAGSGSRAVAAAGGMPVPKQYRAIAGAPLVCHTLAAFAAVPRLAAVLVVVAPGDQFFEQRDASVLIADCGGVTRAASVFNGLKALRTQGAGADDWVLVHDAARCLVTPAQIDTLIDACEHDAVGGLLAQPLSDTLQCSDGDRAVAPLDRSGKWLAQTPQMFRIGPLAEALRRAGPQVTDEASAMEALGHRPLLVHSSAMNFKVTHAEDFALAEAVLRSRT
ncbi:MAG: 2-C-methyl-D-erythritol 4-phosphate cytidylyltransferase [Burkholderiaceae bacterium]|nr:MAG: 2-C-methyl-D-erythritol 4-phosphate cytidylyltransferase [Burkholderiaceae bacterium]